MAYSMGPPLEALLGMGVGQSDQKPQVINWWNASYWLELDKIKWHYAVSDVVRSKSICYKKRCCVVPHPGSSHL